MERHLRHRWRNHGDCAACLDCGAVREGTAGWQPASSAHCACCGQQEKVWTEIAAKPRCKTCCSMCGLGATCQRVTDEEVAQLFGLQTEHSVPAWAPPFFDRRSN